VLKTGGWLIETYHGIEGMGGWEATPLKVFEEHVKYAASKRDEMWIDTIAEIAKYIRERDSASVEIAADSREELVIHLTDKMDDAVFDAPLTLRILTRPGWKSPLTVTQKGRKTRVELVKEAGRPCAYIEAVPDQGQIVIRPAGAAPKRAAARFRCTTALFALADEVEQRLGFQASESARPASGETRTVGQSSGSPQSRAAWPTR
jgi:hypothetical protein